MISPVKKTVFNDKVDWNLYKAFSVHNRGKVYKVYTLGEAEELTLSCNARHFFEIPKYL